MPAANLSLPVADGGETVTARHRRWARAGLGPLDL